MELKTLDAYSRLSGILDTLRQQCPWDRQQTLRSLRYLTIEEVHELSEAIVAGEPDEIKKELGDLAMHLMFYMKIAEEQGLFTAADVYNRVCDKLVDRHPFIYRKDDYHGESWEQLKMREGRKNVLEGVPASLPSMVKAVRILEKVAGVEPEPLPASAPIAPTEGMSESDYGDMLLAIVDWGRRHGFNADDALCAANNRFCERHSH